MNVHIPQLTNLTANDFGDNVLIIFDDSSIAIFKGAFFRKEDNYIVVYTEHCGYRSFLKQSIKTISGKQWKKEQE